MTQENPIRPPHELVQQWVSLACENEGYETWQHLATQAARWGADMELEACCSWVSQFDYDEYSYRDRLYDARRSPKPPSLKEQASEELRKISISPELGVSVQALDTIRRALESLPD